MKNTGKIIAIVLLMLIQSSLYAQSKEETNTHNALSLKEQRIVAISANAAKGDLEQLQVALNEGMDDGLTINEAKEILIHLYAYCGFPRSLNSLGTLQTVLEQRKQNGIEDTEGPVASPLPANKSSYDLGSEVLVQLVGTSEARGIRAFAPAVDTMLKKHLFGDLFGRDVLGFQTREITTIAALSSMKGTQNQLGSHIKVALNIGMTEVQLRGIASVLANNVGWQEGKNMRVKLNEILGLNEPQIVEDQPVTELLFPRGKRISSDHFTGDIWLNMITRDDSGLNTSMGNVTFEPGSRTNWHSHAGGQILMVTEGVGYYQEKGKPKRIIRKGEVIICQPNTEHWHGASQDQFMTHMAMSINTDRGSVQWLKPVTDEEYIVH